MHATRAFPVSSIISTCASSPPRPSLYAASGRPKAALGDGQVNRAPADRGRPHTAVRQLRAATSGECGFTRLADHLAGRVEIATQAVIVPVAPRVAVPWRIRRGKPIAVEISVTVNPVIRARLGVRRNRNGSTVEHRRRCSQYQGFLHRAFTPGFSPRLHLIQLGRIQALHPRLPNALNPRLFHHDIV